MVEDCDTEAEFPLPNVSGDILAKVIEYCTWHYEHPTLQTEEKREPRSLEDIAPWDKEFLNIPTSTVFALILAANYLDIRPLLDLTCKHVALMIKNKTPEEVRKEFNLVDDWTPEQKAQVFSLFYYPFFVPFQK